MSARQEDAARPFEAELIPGLEDFAIDELRSKYGDEVSQIEHTRQGFIRFRYAGAHEQLRALRSVIALYQIYHFALPRPKALLGHEHFARLKRILTATAGSFSGPARTLGIGAAGSQSSVMRRLRMELAEALHLESAADSKGDLFMRIAPARQQPGWEIMARTSRAPLSARDYRVKNMPGSLNATVAYAMTQVGALPAGSAAVNLCSGASIIAIEHALLRPGDHLLAVDFNAEALAAGRHNARASGADSRISHLLADGANAPLASHSADRVYADLPFGHHIGSHEANARLYPAILREASRLARRGALFVALTHELRLMRHCLAMSNWRAVQQTKVNLRGLNPRLFVLRKISDTI
jgi:23S rRNA G2445 N2-methylase RlmL